MKDGEKTYSTSQIAGIVGLHPNTVRKYEEWGLLQTPERKPNGYRVYTDVHIKQFELAKKALQSVIVQAGLRKMMIDTVKLSARYQYDEAIELVERYIVIVRVVNLLNSCKAVSGTFIKCRKTQCFQWFMDLVVKMKNYRILS